MFTMRKSIWLDFARFEVCQILLNGGINAVHDFVSTSLWLSEAARVRP